MGESRYIPIVVDEVLKETDKAFLCLIEGTQYWIPKSQMEDSENVSEGELDCEMAITEWIAQEKGLL